MGLAAQPRNGLFLDDTSIMKPHSEPPTRATNAPGGPKGERKQERPVVNIPLAASLAALPRGRVFVINKTRQRRPSVPTQPKSRAFRSEPPPLTRNRRLVFRDEFDYNPPVSDGWVPAPRGYKTDGLTDRQRAWAGTLNALPKARRMVYTATRRADGRVVVKRYVPTALADASLFSKPGFRDTGGAIVSWAPSPGLSPPPTSNKDFAKFSRGVGEPVFDVVLRPDAYDYKVALDAAMAANKLARDRALVSVKPGSSHRWHTTDYRPASVRAGDRGLIDVLVPFTADVPSGTPGSYRGALRTARGGSYLAKVGSAGADPAPVERVHLLSGNGAPLPRPPGRQTPLSFYMDPVVAAPTPFDMAAFDAAARASRARGYDYQRVAPVPATRPPLSGKGMSAYHKRRLAASRAAASALRTSRAKHPATPAESRRSRGLGQGPKRSNV